MPSSISSSENRVYLQPIASTLVILVVLLLALEAGIRIGFTRVSHVESRIERDYHAAIAARKGGSSHPTILLLGNSLLLEGVDYEGLKHQMESKAQPIRFVIEQTQYLDWYYGIQRLLSEGSRPDRIVLCLNINHLMSNSIRGEYSAAYLFRTQDLFRVGTDTGLNLTGVSDLLVARYSMFYAGRHNLRNFVLNNVAPGYSGTLHGFNNASPMPPATAEILSIAAPRLVKLRELCAQYQVAFELLLPPGFSEGTAGLLDAGKQSGVSVLIPVAQHSWNANLFRDTIHLNKEGAIRFTRVLGDLLVTKTAGVQ